MSSHTWVCFHCRDRVRRQAGASQVRCRLCGRPCDHFGTKIEAPPKSKIREWAELREWYFAGLRAFYLKRQEQHARRRHTLEREIERYQRLAPDKQRRAYIRKIEAELNGIAI
jgi:hypothetical protein